MRVLGVDPGLSRCGVGVVQSERSRQSMVLAGVIRTPAHTPTPARLATLYDELSALLARHRPDAVAVERVFFNANVATAMSVGQAAGMALLSAAQAGVPVTEYTPTQVKSTITGTGDAPKEQVGFMVQALLRLDDVPRPADAADALALALCHLRRAGGPGVDTRTENGAGALTGHATASGMSPRLAAAAEAAHAGAQIVQRRRTETP